MARSMNLWRIVAGAGAACLVVWASGCEQLTGSSQNAAVSLSDWDAASDTATPGKAFLTSPSPSSDTALQESPGQRGPGFDTVRTAGYDVSADETPVEADRAALMTETSAPVSLNRSAEARRQLDRLRRLVGQWRGTTRKAYGGFRAVETIRWELGPEGSHPALLFSTDGDPYFRSGRIRWVPSAAQYRLTAFDQDGLTHEIFGEMTTDSPAGNARAGRVSVEPRLVLTEIAPPSGDRWRLVFEFPSGDRYMLRLLRQGPDGTFAAFDAVEAIRVRTTARP